jgi:hypothetical protein
VSEDGREARRSLMVCALSPLVVVASEDAQGFSDVSPGNAD